MLPTCTQYRFSIHATRQWYQGGEVGGTYGSASISYAPCQATAFDFAGRRVGLARCDFWFARDESDELDLGVLGTETGVGERDSTSSVGSVWCWLLASRRQG